MRITHHTELAHDRAVTVSEAQATAKAIAAPAKKQDHQPASKWLELARREGHRAKLPRTMGDTVLSPLETRVLDNLKEGMTSRDVTDLIGHNFSSVSNALSGLAGKGMVERIGQTGQLTIWKPSTPKRPSLSILSNYQRKVISVMTKPMTCSEIAKASGRPLEGLRPMLKRMRDRGFIRVAGTKGKGAVVAQLWVAND
jgi:predicted transcriptional regulator